VNTDPANPIAMPSPINTPPSASTMRRRRSGPAEAMRIPSSAVRERTDDARNADDADDRDQER
jgi:hypothetical protein